MSQTDATRLYIPPRTRLETVWRTVNGHWQVWTACPDRNAPFHQMLGTCLILDSNGSAQRMTVRPDGTVEITEVMPK